MQNLILSLVTAFTLTYFAIPPIIRVAKLKHLYDEPGDRRVHTESTPSLGGLGIFAGFIFSIFLWMPINEFGELQYMISAVILTFLIGLKDDIFPLDPVKKLIGQILVAVILVFKSNVRITSFCGLFGVTVIPDWMSILVSIFAIVVIMNSFNLIDGINGLCGSISSLICVIFGIWFYQADRLELAIISFATVGAVAAFLRYNFTPAQIFMGDTGSLLLGLICSVLAIEFVETQGNVPAHLAAYSSAAPAVAIGVLIIPLFDTLRVFTTRMLRGRSPFQADRTHIHHLLLGMGLSHLQATVTLVAINILFIFLAFQLQYIGTLPLLLLILFIAGSSSGVLYFWVSGRQGQS